MNEVLYLGKTNFREEQKVFGIKRDDRRRHMYILGKSGTGKTTLLENSVIQDIQNGNGVCVIDPHGEFASRVLSFVPEDKINNVVYFNPSDTNFPLAFNPLENVDFDMRHLVASGLMAVFKKIWPDVWSARMEYILNNTLLALLEYPNSTLLSVMKMFSNKEYRKEIVDNLKDPVVKSFWEDEFAKYTQRLETEAVASIQNKIGQFIANPLIRNIIGQSRSSFNFRKIMDNGGIFIADLSKGRIGEDNSALLGAMLITKTQLAAMSRVDQDIENRKDFYLYVDEFQNFATESFATILSEARKYRLSLILAHQYIEQLDESERVKSAIFGNIGTMIMFRVGASDAGYLEKEFSPEFMSDDFVNLPNFQYYIKLMIDGLVSHPFSAYSLLPMIEPDKTFVEEIINMSRAKYALKKQDVENRISKEYYNGDKNNQDENKRKNKKSFENSLKKQDKVFSKPTKFKRKNVDVNKIKETIRKALNNKSDTDKNK